METVVVSHSIVVAVSDPTLITNATKIVNKNWSGGHTKTPDSGGIRDGNSTCTADCNTN